MRLGNVRLVPGKFRSGQSTGQRRILVSECGFPSDPALEYTGDWTQFGALIVAKNTLLPSGRSWVSTTLIKKID